MKVVAIENGIIRHQFAYSLIEQRRSTFPAIAPEFAIHAYKKCASLDHMVVRKVTGVSNGWRIGFQIAYSNDRKTAANYKAVAIEGKSILDLTNVA